MKSPKSIPMLFLFLFVVFFYAIPHASAEDIRGRTVFNEINAERLAKKEPALIPNIDLVRAAQARANDMATFGYFSHRSPQGKNVWDFIMLTKYRPFVAGENLAVGYTDTSSLVTAWMNSPTHRENILYRGFTQTGIGIASGVFRGKQVIFVVQLFGGK